MIEARDGRDESDSESDRNPDDEWMKRRDTLTQLPNTIPDGIRPLFGDFVDREGVKASARLMIKHENEVIGILFVNFDKPITFDEALKRNLQTLRDDVGEEIKGGAAFSAEDVLAQQAVSLLRPMQEWVADIYRTPKSEVSSLNTILADMMSGLGMDAQRGFGTIHLYRPENNDLVLKAHCGLPLAKTRKFQSVIKGEGIISWVALRRCSMFIENIQKSKFSEVYISLREGMTSALAVPMMERDELVGVLNFESEKPNQFQEQDARVLWYAARAAAVAIRLRHEATIAARRAQISAELLKWQGLMIAGNVAERKAFNAFARIACDALEAAEADIWKFDSSRPGPFSLLGATYPPQDQVAPREKGLSDYVCRSQTEIWITNSQGSNQLNAEYWNKQGLRWDTTPPRIGAPESANPHVTTSECAFELGIPLIHEGECLGVAWLKFTSEDRSHPSVEETSLAEEFAQGVGCILKFWPARSSVAESGLNSKA
jgi:GAF domain-containing protein